MNFGKVDWSQFELVYKSNLSEGFVAIHHFHGKNEKKQNLEVAILLANRGFNIFLLEDIKNKRSADASINNLIWEFKIIQFAKNIKNAVQKQIRRSIGQANNLVIFVKQNVDESDLMQGIFNGLQIEDKQKTINKIIILFKTRKFLEFERDDVLNKNFRDIFKEKIEKAE